jgi:hypothetical protein
VSAAEKCGAKHQAGNKLLIIINKKAWQQDPGKGIELYHA